MEVYRRLVRDFKIYLNNTEEYIDKIEEELEREYGSEVKIIVLDYYREGFSNYIKLEITYKTTLKGVVM